MRDERLPRRARVLAVAALLLLTACAGPDAGSTADTPTASATEAGGAPDVDIASLGAASIAVEPFADFAMSSGELVWVSGAAPGIVAYDAGMDAVLKVETGEVTAALAFGHGAVWAAETSAGGSATTLLRVDATTGAVQRFPVPAPGVPPESSIGVTDDAVWVAIPSADDGGAWTAHGLDPATGASVRSIDLGDDAVAAVRGGFGSVWVTRATGVLGRYDAMTGESRAEIALSRSSTFLSIGPDAVWVMNQLGEVARVDPRTDEVVATIEANPGGIIGGDIVATDDAVWLQATTRLGVEIDPATNEVVRRLVPAQGSGGVAVTDDGAVWFTAHDEEALHRIPPP